MKKYPDIVPSELKISKARKFIRDLKGLISSEEPTDEALAPILQSWDDAYRENLERITYDNVSSYEP
jgi:hypothetical protein